MTTGQTGATRRVFRTFDEYRAAFENDTRVERRRDEEPFAIGLRLAVESLRSPSDQRDAGSTIEAS